MTVGVAESTRLTALVFVNVNVVAAELCPTLSEGYVAEAGVSVAVGVALNPLPDSPAVADTPFVVSFSDSVFVYMFGAVGVKETITVQVDPAASVDPHGAEPPEVTEKMPAGETLTATLSVAVPVFESVNCCVAVVPTFTLAKLKLVGDHEGFGVAPPPPTSG